MDFFKEVFRFFIAKEYSFTTKFIGFLVVIFTIFLIDNLLGFSFYYSNNQKITQIKTIQTLKKECSDNKDLLETLIETERKIIERKNIIEGFINLFSQESIDKPYLMDPISSDTIYIIQHDTIFISKNSLSDSIILDTLNIISNKFETSSKYKNKISLRSRSKIWHTITSSYGFLIILILLPVVPFFDTKFSWNTIMGILFFMLLLSAIIWLNQYLLGLIPLILNKPWINYIINLLIHTIILFLFSRIKDKNNAT